MTCSRCIPTWHQDSNNSRHSDEEIDLKEFSSKLWSRKNRTLFSNIISHLSIVSKIISKYYLSAVLSLACGTTGPTTRWRAERKQPTSRNGSVWTGEVERYYVNKWSLEWASSSPIRVKWWACYNGNCYENDYTMTLRPHRLSHHVVSLLPNGLPHSEPAIQWQFENRVLWIGVNKNIDRKKKNSKI